MSWSLLLEGTSTAGQQVDRSVRERGSIWAILVEQAPEGTCVLAQVGDAERCPFGRVASPLAWLTSRDG